MAMVALDLVLPNSTNSNSKTVVFIIDNLLQLININLISCESISLRYSKQANCLLWTFYYKGLDINDIYTIYGLSII